MAATIKKELYIGNRIYLRSTAQVHGEGAPANGDALVTNTKQYPVGIEYIDLTSKVAYKRVATVGTASDFVVATNGAIADNVAQVTTADGSDAATTQALANQLKTTVNGILTSLKTAGIMEADA